MFIGCMWAGAAVIHVGEPAWYFSVVANLERSIIKSGKFGGVAGVLAGACTFKERNENSISMIIQLSELSKKPWARFHSTV